MPQYWFRQRRFGYGATPNTWQGRAWTIGSFVLIVAILAGAQFIDNILWRLIVLVTLPAIVIVIMVSVAGFKTEGGWRWRWGE